MRVVIERLNDVHKRVLGTSFKDIVINDEGKYTPLMILENLLVIVIRQFSEFLEALKYMHSIRSWMCFK